MKTICKLGEFTLVQDGLWTGTIDNSGKMRISPDLHYRSILEFVNGVAIAYQNEKWGLIDTDGNHISEFKYNFIQPAGEGYYRAEIGAKENLLRSDGSEVLPVWLNRVYNVTAGFFKIGITQRKTKTTPTKYFSGVAHVSGDIIFPVIFDLIREFDVVDEEYKGFFYAELDGAPYILTPNGSISDPGDSHLPQKLEIDKIALIEKFVNWTLPGLQFFYRDTDAPVAVDTTYHVGDVVRAGFFVDASTKLLKPKQKTRFLIASAHAAMLFEDEEYVRNDPNVKEWNMCVFHYNSYFKVMDVYEKEGVTQVFLLHIPLSAAFFLNYSNTTICFVDDSIREEQSLVDMARRNLDEKLTMEVHQCSLDKTWEERTFHPIGLDDDFTPLSISPMPEPTEGDVASLSRIIHKMANDEDIEGYIIKKDNFPFTGVKGSVCEKCIYAKSVTEKAEGCGRLFQKTFRDRWMRGRCEYWKDSLWNPSAFEFIRQQNQIEAKDKEEKESDVYALRLVKEFIAEKLDGDIDKMKSYDFSLLKGDEKYGDCDGHAFSVKDCSVMKAILVLVFKEAWPGLTYESIEKHKYKGDAINIIFTLFGNYYDGHFQNLESCEVSSTTISRVEHFRDLTHTVGNIMVLPTGFCMMRDTKPMGRGYADVFLDAFYRMMINAKKCNMKLLDALNFKKKELIAYRTEANFYNTVRVLMLDDFLDRSGFPKKVFEGVVSADPSVDMDTFYRASEEFLDFCESFIPRRSIRIVEKLKSILSA